MGEVEQGDNSRMEDVEQGDNSYMEKVEQEEAGIGDIKFDAVRPSTPVNENDLSTIPIYELREVEGKYLIIYTSLGWYSRHIFHDMFSVMNGPKCMSWKTHV